MRGRKGRRSRKFCGLSLVDQGLPVLDDGQRGHADLIRHECEKPAAIRCRINRSNHDARRKAGELHRSPDAQPVTSWLDGDPPQLTQVGRGVQQVPRVWCPPPP